MSAPPRLPGPAVIFGRVVLLGALICGGFALHGLLTYVETSRDVVPYLLGVYVGAMGVCLPLLRWAAGPYTRLQRLLDGGTPPLELPRDDVVRALRLPTRVFWLVLGQFAVGILAAPLAGLTILPGLLYPETLRDIVVGGTALGLIAAANQLYAATNLIRARVAPVLLVDGTLRHLGAVRAMRVWQHLLLLAVVCGIAWPVLLVIVIDDHSEPSVLGTLVLVCLAAALFSYQLVSAQRIVSQGVGHLMERMQEVRDGDLDVRAQVRGLDTLSEMASHFNAMVEGLRQREQLKETFGRYVTKQVADEILAGRVQLGGELKTATVLFSDIRGFTQMSERMSPVEVVSFLNEYLTAMVDCVLEHGGVLDKFIGDAVMAVFGAPLSRGVDRDAESAVACALAMGERLDEINLRRRQRGQVPIRIGIGVHTGELVAGNIGSPRRMEYTVIGDTVNVGSRLESLTKELHRQTLLSAATAALVQHRFSVVDVGVVSVRGRTEPLRVFGLADERVDPVGASPRPATVAP